MDKLVQDGNGTTALLAGLVIILCLHLLMKLAHFIWEFNNKKHELTEESIKQLTSVISSNTSAQIKLEDRLSKVEIQINDFNKFKLDVRLLMEAIKKLSGDRWPEIRKIIVEDKFPT